MQCQNKDNNDRTPLVDSTIGTTEPSSYTGLIIVVILPAFAFLVAVVGETRIRIVRVMRGYHLQKRALIHLEHKLAQSEEEKARLASNLWDSDQAFSEKKEQHKEALEDAKGLRKKLARSDHDELLLRRDLAVSKENIKGLQATVAKKGKEALEYRAQAYRPTHETLPAHMSRMRFIGNQIPVQVAWPSTHTHTAAQAQEGNHARFTKHELDAGGRNLHTGGTRETLGGNGHADTDIRRYTPAR